MTQARKSKNKGLVVVLIAVVILAALGGLILKERQHARMVYAESAAPKIDGSLLPKPRDIKPFTLEGIDGKSFTEKSLAGHWSLLFFGFANCAMVCPTTMAELTKMYEALGKTLPQSDLPEVIFVSVDPERDSLTRLKEYVHAFNPHFTAARGEVPALKKLTDQVSVVFAKVYFRKGDDKHYAVTHSAEIMVINPKGQLVAFLAYPHQAAKMVKDYEWMLKHRS